MWAAVVIIGPSILDPVTAAGEHTWKMARIVEEAIDRNWPVGSPLLPFEAEVPMH